MFKTLITATAASALALSAALAQTSSPAPAQKPSAGAIEKSQTQPMQKPSTGSVDSKMTTTTPAMNTTGKPVVIAKQLPGQLLVSKFQGADVVGTDDKKIGDVNDVLFTRDGTVVAYVIGVGGFLGIGTKDIALEPTSLEVVPGTDGGDIKLRVAMTKEELTQAASFERYQPPRPAASNAPLKRPLGQPATQ
ncbi:MAG: PRC-barrel domain-containing protein [Pseudolabrys sp.]